MARLASPWRHCFLALNRCVFVSLLCLPSFSLTCLLSFQFPKCPFRNGRQGARAHLSLWLQFSLVVVSLQTQRRLRCIFPLVFYFLFSYTLAPCACLWSSVIRRQYVLKRTEPSGAHELIDSSSACEEIPMASEEGERNSILGSSTIT